MKPHLRLIQFFGLIVPRRLRADWRQEWEAELHHREELLAQWDKLNWQTKLDLLRRSTSAFWDALWLLSPRWEDEMIQDLRYGVRMSARYVLGVFIAIYMLVLVAVGQDKARRLDEKRLRETVQTVAQVIRQEYFDVEVGARTAAQLAARLAEGRYQSSDTVELLAQVLTRDLYELTRDKHLAVLVIASPATPTAPIESREQAGRRTNYGVARVEVLAGNVGYLKLNSFYHRDEMQEALSSALRVLRNADALLLDLRDNGGGAPDSLVYLLSHFVRPANTPLFEIVARSGDKQRYAATVLETVQPVFKLPLFALTSRHTFSAGEGVAYLLQERKLAEIVGETTAGAANPGRPYPVNEWFEIVVPNGRVITAVKRGNWEGTGVIPDVAVAAQDALRVAHLRALNQLLQTLEPGLQREALQRELEVLRRGGQ